MKFAKFAEFIAVMLAVVIMLCAVPFAIPAAIDDALVISDCTSGWSYSGNSEISYSEEGTSGNGVSVAGSYGVLQYAIIKSFRLFLY